MGAVIEWPALDFVAERFGVGNVELFMQHLVTIRDHQQTKESARG